MGRRHRAGRWEGSTPTVRSTPRSREASPYPRQGRMIMGMARLPWAPRSAVSHRKRGWLGARRLGGENIAPADFGFDKALRRRAAQRTKLFAKLGDDRGHCAIGVARPR